MYECVYLCMYVCLKMYVCVYVCVCVCAGCGKAEFAELCRDQLSNPKDLISGGTVSTPPHLTCTHVFVSRSCPPPVVRTTIDSFPQFQVSRFDLLFSKESNREKKKCAI